MSRLTDAELKAMYHTRSRGEKRVRAVLWLLTLATVAVVVIVAK